MIFTSHEDRLGRVEHFRQLDLIPATSAGDAGFAWCGS